MHRLCWWTVILVMWCWDTVSLQWFMQKCADIPTSVHRAHTFRALCMGFPPAGLPTHTPCLPGACGWAQEHLISPLGQARCQTLGSWWVEGASRHPYSNFLLQTGLVRVGCSNEEPCPVEFGNNPLPWAPLTVFDHPHSEIFFFMSGGNFLCSRLCLLP